MYKRQGVVKNSFGFTLIELLVVMAMTAIISSFMLVNVNQGKRNSSLRAASDTIQSTLRQIQNSVLSGEKHPGGNPARDFGMEITSIPATQFLLFVEEKDASGNPINRINFETMTLTGGAQIDNLQVGPPGSLVDKSSLVIRYFPPFASLAMTTMGYSETNNLLATFDIVHPDSTKTYTVTIDGISGRISVQ